MNIKLFWTLGLCFLLAFAATATEAQQERSQTAKNQFKAMNPCPANGNTYGPCPGYVIDHIEPLACGGADAPSICNGNRMRQARPKTNGNGKAARPHHIGDHPRHPAKAII